VNGALDFCRRFASPVVGRARSLNRLLAIYLNDHLAGATAGVELACRRS
jgi:hypothetical protein